MPKTLHKVLSNQSFIRDQSLWFVGLRKRIFNLLDCATFGLRGQRVESWILCSYCFGNQNNKKNSNCISSLINKPPIINWTLAYQQTGELNSNCSITSWTIILMKIAILMINTHYLWLATLTHNHSTCSYLQGIFGEKITCWLARTTTQCMNPSQSDAVLSQNIKQCLSQLVCHAKRKIMICLPTCNRSFNWHFPFKIIGYQVLTCPSSGNAGILLLFAGIGRL